jgi:hypothetical protein
MSKKDKKKRTDSMEDKKKNEIPPKSSFIQLLGCILIIDGLFAGKEE